MPVLFVVYNFLQISLRQYWTMNKEFSQFRNFTAAIKSRYNFGKQLYTN
jgi:hypothetical protein